MLKHSLMALTLAFAATSAAAMSDTERAAALRGLDDEYGAYATYTAVLEKFGPVEPFVSIRESEREHIAALVRFLEAEGVEVPENPYLNGEKPAPEAPDTVQEACAIGVEAEIANAALYDDDLLPAVAGNPQLERIFNNLKTASSTHHLPAFRACAG